MSCAMTLLQAGVDTSVIALWLGHAGVRPTYAYLHADISIKKKALALTTPAWARPGRYRPPDKVLAFEGLYPAGRVESGVHPSLKEQDLMM
jgi:hypothetical protein